MTYLDTALSPRPTRAVHQEHINVARINLKGYLKSLFYLAAHQSIDQGYTASSRWDCFIQAVYLAHLLNENGKRTGKRVEYLHAHFAHDPALIAFLVHCMAGIPYSFTAHARDLYQVPQKVLYDRIRSANAVVTCCQANLDYLRQVAPSQQSKFAMIYHGINLAEFQPVLHQIGEPPHDCPLILSVGRLVEKKGFLDLLQALYIARQKGASFHCYIYGDGPLCELLGHWLVEHGMERDVLLIGDRTQQELVSVYQNATLFALTPFFTEDGDRDGIPNVLLEAMAVGLPVVTTAVAGIPEVVAHNQNGLLYQPHDVEGISSGIIELLGDADKRQRLGITAMKKVNELFDISQAANRLRALMV